MKIAYIVHQFPPYHLGGTENYAWSLGRWMAEQGHDVAVFYPLSVEVEEAQQIHRDGMDQWRVPLSSHRKNAGPAKEFWHAIRDAAIETSFADFLEYHQPHVVHIQHLQNVSIKLLERAQNVLRKPIPTVMTLQDYWYFCANGQLIRPSLETCGGTFWGMNCVDCAAERGNAPWLPIVRPLAAVPFYWRNRYIMGLLSSIKRFIAPSEFLRQMYIQNGFPAEQICTMEYGLDLHRLLPSPSAVANLEEDDRSTYDLHNEQIAIDTINWGEDAALHVGFLGSIAKQKGIDVLIRAFNQLPETARLTIHGSESAFPEFAKAIRKMAQHPGIRFGGPLHHEFTGRVMQSFDCLVIPSIWYENSPLVIQEAFAANVPVIGSRLGSMPEKISEGVTGRLFTPGDASDLANVLLSLLQDSEQIAQFKSNIQPAPSMQSHGREIEKLYHSIAAQGTP